MPRKLFLILRCLLFCLLIAGLTAFNLLLFWVATGPRSLDSVSPYIESALDSDNYHVKIEHTWLIWDGWRHPISVKVRGVSVLTNGGQVFSTFPEVELGINLLALPFGQILPTSITLDNPVLHLYQNEDHSISLGFMEELQAAQPSPPPEQAAASSPAPADTADNSSFTIPVAALIDPLLSTDLSNSFRKLHNITIHNATATLHTANRHVLLQAKNLEISLKRDREGGVTLRNSALVSYDTFQSPIKLQLELMKGQPTIGQFTFKGIMPSALAAVFTDNADVAGVHVPLDGTLEFSVDQSGLVQRAHFNVKGGSGSVHTDKLDGDLNINSLAAAGQISDNFHNIQLDALSVDIDHILLSANGLVLLNNDDISIRGDAGLKNVPGSALHLLWPPSVSPESRSWVLENITGGSVPEVKAHINIPFGDRAKPALPKEDIDASLTLEGAKVRYLPGHPDITNVKGVLHVDGQSLTADIESGDYMKDSKISNGHLEIADLNADDPHIVVSFNAVSSARDAINFLKLPRVNHAARLNLNDQTAGGTANLTAKVGFDFYAPKDENGKPIDADVDFDLTADMKGISQAGFMKKFDLKDCDGKFSINNSGIGFKGKGQINGADVSDATIKYLFKPDNGFDTFIDATATAPVEALPRFGYPAFAFLKGSLGIKASLKQGDTKEDDTASIDLTNTAIDWKQIGLAKPGKEPATLDLIAKKQDGVMRITSFKMKGKSIDIAGSAILNKDVTNIQSVTLEKEIFGRNDLDKLYFEFTDGGFNLQAEGRSADITPFVKHDPKQPGTFSFEHFPAVHASGEVGTLIWDDTGPGHELSDVKGTLNCDPHICSDANISGKAGDKPFSFRILRNPTGRRQLTLHAENGGAFVNALNIMEAKMEGGDLSITGNYTETEKGNSLLKGKIDITEYTVKGAPVLGKILSIGSFTGLIDNLQGNGVRFTRLSAPFSISNDVVTFEKVRCYGPSIGFTMDGTVTFPAGTLNMEGTMVPAYTLNSAFSKVPLVGSVLTGGEGQGVFAANYRVTGTEDKPDVSVNPLSILTPGFLRGVFDIFDTPTPAEAEQEKEERRNKSASPESPSPNN